MIWTDEHINFIRETLPGRSFTEAYQLFIEKFDAPATFQMYRAACKNRKIVNGRITRFEKGQISHNKGVKVTRSQYEQMKPTMFKAGHKPHNYLPVGSERVNSEGYVKVKIADPDKWEFKHKLVYRERYGEIPKGCAVIFKDQNKLNCEIDNLLLVSKHELSMMNQMHLITHSPELTEAGLIVAKMHDAISKRRKRK